jgi:diguanylate cyclase (GGDEF)-like protein
MAVHAHEDHEVLPGELATFRAVGVLGFVLGAIGGIALWLSDPGVIHSSPVASATTLACVVMAAVMAVVPWARVHPAWLLTPATVAAVVIAAAIQNMDGGREVYDGFYLYLALSAGYFLPGRYLKIVIAIIAVASAVPLIVDSSSESIVRWAYVAAGNGTVAVVVRVARVRVRAYAAEVRMLALQDQLTGALNRRGFEQRAGEEIARARRHGLRFALVYLDLDGFKLVNDNLSHAAGDRVLRRAALAMAATVRGEDVLARVGGDEFVALLPCAADADADRVAARLVAAVESVAAVEAGAEHVSATTAWSAYPADGETLDALLNAADARMLERKRARPLAR